MNNTTKLLLVGGLGVAAYMLWKKSRAVAQPDAFVSTPYGARAVASGARPIVTTHADGSQSTDFTAAGYDYRVSTAGSGDGSSPYFIGPRNNASGGDQSYPQAGVNGYRR